MQTMFGNCHEESRPSISNTEMLLRAGQCREKIKRVNEVISEINTSKHNPIWELGDEKQCDELWELRGKLVTIQEDLEEVESLLMGY